MRSLIIFLILTSCESYFYDDYKIIDIRSSNRDEIVDLNIKEYFVKSGDNLYSISKKFKISIQDLIRTNNIVEPYKIFPRQIILIPKNKIYKIKKGDTLYSISRRYETNIFELSKINNISDVNNLKIGQKIRIPKKTYKNKINQKQKSLNKIKKENIKRISDGFKKRKNKTIFLWPVKGEIVSKYGKNQEGFYNDGINIFSKKGTKVISSADGKVIYSGNEIPGYGNLILIKHSKNWITAYAHLNEVFIYKGKSVKKGEKIGSVGNTGNVRKPQLHFEIRKGKESVDPMRLL